MVPDLVIYGETNETEDCNRAVRPACAQCEWCKEPATVMRAAIVQAVWMAVRGGSAAPGIVVQGPQEHYRPSFVPVAAVDPWGPELPVTHN